MSSAPEHPAIPYFVSSSAVRQALAWPECLAAITDTYTAGAAVTPARTVASSPAGQWLRTLPSLPGTGRYFGAKFMGGRRATATSTPLTHYLIVLFDRETGEFAGLVDANLVTAYRTAATTAIAIRALASRRGDGPVSLGVIGTGLEAQMHSRAVVAALPVSEVTMYSPTRINRERVTDLLRDELGVPFTAADSTAQAVSEATVVVAAARSRDEKPILSMSDLGRCHTVASIGSTVPSQREIDVDVIVRSGVIVCDVPGEVTHETGDFLAAAAAGIDLDDRVFGIERLFGPTPPPGLAECELALYKSVGSGLQDIVIAELALTRALAQGTAVPLPISLEPKH